MKSNNGYDNQALEMDHHWDRSTESDTRLPSSIETTPEEKEDDGRQSSNALVRIRSQIFYYASENSVLIKRVLGILAVVTFFVYFGFAMDYGWKNQPVDWCNGARLLLILTIITLWFVLYYTVIKPIFGKTIYNRIMKPIDRAYQKVFAVNIVRWLFYLVLLAAVVAFIVVDGWDEPQRLISAAGVVVYVLFGFLFSKYPDKIIWRQVIWGLALQFIFALLILRWSVGKSVFQCLGDKVSTFLAYTDAGSSFVFGYLVTGQLAGNVNFTLSDGTELISPLPVQAGLFAFKTLTVIIFFSFFVAILYYYGIMQVIVVKVGWLLQVTVGTTAAESVNASANIFLGQTEAPLMIKPFLKEMTKSELHAVMTGGFATIAGTVMAAYIDFGVSASHLLSASVMSAPAALGYSKLFYPENEKSKTNVANIVIDKGQEKTALEAAANGASTAVTLIGNIAANLIGFLAFIAFVDAIIAWIGSLVGWDFLNFEWLMSKIFVPLAFIMGVEWEDCEEVAQLIGLKTIVNEFVAYAKLSEMKRDNAISERSQIIATYILCGFSNISSIGIQIGGLGGLAPERKPDLAEIAVRALIAGSIACFLTACIAGTLISTS